jgi:microcystin-dependent protein
MPDNATLPSGTILAFGGTPDKVPSGYLLCDGSALVVNDFQALYNAIGFSWGGNPENGTFFLPDLRGIFIRGADNGAGRDPNANSRYLQGDSGQSDTGVGSWQNDDLQNHQHSWSHFFSNISYSGSDIAVAQPNWSDNLQNNAGQITDSGGGSPGNETRPINAAVNYIISTGS